MKLWILHISLVLLIKASSCQGKSLSISSKMYENQNSYESKPIIDRVNIVTDIQYRYARTVVKTLMKNPSIHQAQQVFYNMVLPETAFISNFTIQMGRDEKIYVANVEEKQTAKQLYDIAVASGHTAGLVNTNAREAKQITVSTNLEATQKVMFTLTYEELLRRHDSKYEYNLYVYPGQIVPDYRIEVNINESLPLRAIRVPAFDANPNTIKTGEDNQESDLAIIKTNVDGDPNKAHILFKPDAESQKRLGRQKINLKDTKQGMSGIFSLHYDVDRKHEGNDIQIIDGYFVHFFAPEQLEVLPKHVVLVLDTSGSMNGRKLEQIKDGMSTIIGEILDQDYLNIFTFSSTVKNWVPGQEKEKSTGRMAYQGSKSIRKEAIKYTQKLDAYGGTNIHDALTHAIELIRNVTLAKELPSNIKPMIIFMTDGEATTGITNTDEIIESIKLKNQDLKVPIFGLAFGKEADFNMLKELTVATGGFSRRIYEASDAAIQLEGFFSEISSPLLQNLTFEYIGDFQDTTKKDFGTYFKGGEYVIANKIKKLNHEKGENLKITIQGEAKGTHFKKIIKPCFKPLSSTLRPLAALPNRSFKEKLSSETNDEPSGSATLVSNSCIPIEGQKSQSENNFLERLWAYLTIQDLLKNNKETDTPTIEAATNLSRVAILPIVKSQEIELPPVTRQQKALNIALQYNFVTELTSLVVVQPSATQQEGDSTKKSVLDIKLLHTNNVASQKSHAARGRFYHRNANCPSCRVAQSFGHSGVLRSATGIITPTIPNLLKTVLPIMSERSPENINTIVSHNYSRHQLDSYPDYSNSDLTAPSKCSINLYSKTYLRNLGLVFDKSNGTSVENLLDFNFDDEVASVKVKGQCCWELYTEPNFDGMSETFNEGEYLSVTLLGNVLKDASSLKVRDQPC